MLITQNPEAPAEIRHALIDLAGQDTTEIRIASAYVTHSGSGALLKVIERSLEEEAFAAIPKLLVTSFDFGLTEPLALTSWLKLSNGSVRVVGAEMLQAGSLNPSLAFHPKMYAFRKGNSKFNLLVGSANLTTRGLTRNFEAAWAQEGVPAVEVDNAFDHISQQSVNLSDDLLTSYKSLRKQRPPPPEIRGEVESVEAPALVSASSLLLFRDAIESGSIRLQNHSTMWVQVEKLQGGSGSQLEMPRGAHSFFGFQFAGHHHQDVQLIGRPNLRSAAHTWQDRPLTWHGNNRMERLNLPTQAQGGFSYADSAVMFRRLPDHSFELIVEPWESDIARAWRHASTQSQLLFKLGRNTSRLVGLIRRSNGKNDAPVYD